MKRLAYVLLAACASESEPAPTSELAPPEVGTGFQLDEGKFQLEPGLEGLYCMRLAIPDEYSTEPMYVREIESRLPGGTHHFFMAYRQDAIAGSKPCFDTGALVTVAESDAHDGGGGKILFLSGEGAYKYALPEGYAFYLPTAGGHFVTSHHVLNATDHERDMYGVFNIHTAKAEQVTHPLNSFNCLLHDIWVAPRSTNTVSATCVAPFDLDLVVLSSHAHQHLKKFEMKVGGDVIYTSKDWDSPSIVTLDEPLHLAKGAGIDFSCTFENRGDEWIVFGTGEYGEMCAIMSNYAFPKNRPNEVPPSLGTVIYQDGASAELIETTDIDGPF